jgi:hypothetical protein
LVKKTAGISENFTKMIYNKKTILCEYYTLLGLYVGSDPDRKENGTIVKETDMRWVRVAVPVVLVSLALLLWFISCGGGGSGGRTLEGDVTFNIGGGGKNVEFSAGDTWAVAFSVNYDVGSFGGPYKSLTLNLQDSLADVDFSPLALGAGSSENASALAATLGQMWLYIGRQEQSGVVCDEGEGYGPFNVTINTSSQLTTVSPPTATATNTTMDIINTGAYSFCVKVVSPVNATVDLNSVDVNIEPCDEVPADILGAWAGTYSCFSSCGDIIDDTVSLFITQNASDSSKATYTDGDADYEGTVCGNRFSFSGGGDNYSESGTFVMDPGGATATKTSTYRDYPPGTCSGECSDVLSRIE